jgi:hypothetical protein
MLCTDEACILCDEFFREAFLALAASSFETSNPLIFVTALLPLPLSDMRTSCCSLTGLELLLKRLSASDSSVS